MPDEYMDSSGNTEQFRAFAESAEPAQERSGPSLGLMIGGAVAAVVVIALIAWLAMG